MSVPKNCVIIALKTLKSPKKSPKLGCRNSFIPVLAILFLLTANASAENGEITGRIFNPGGYPLAGVNVRVLNTPRGAATDQDGRFALTDLPPSDYAVVFSHLGYMSDTLSVTITEGEIASIMVVLHENILELQGVELVLDRERVEDQATSGRVIFRSHEVTALPGGSEDPLRAMALIPGVVAQNPNDADWSVRGADLDEMRVLLDGMSLPRPTHFLLASRRLSIFNPLVTDRFELWKGGMPAAYGRALGGSLQVESKDTDAEEPQGTLVLTYLFANLGWEVPFTESLRWIGGVRLNYDPGIYEHFENFFNDRYVRPTLRDTQGSLWFDASDKHRFQLTYLLSYDRLLYSDEWESDDHRNQLAAGGLGWSWVPRSGWFSHSVLYAWQMRDIYRLMDSAHESEWRNGRLGFRNEQTILIPPGGQLKAGVVVEGDEGDRQSPAYKYYMEGTLRSLYAAGFVEGRIRWGHLQTTLGAREDYYLWETSDQGSSTRFNPRIGVGYNLTEEVILKGSWGIFTQPRDTVVYQPVHWATGVEVHRGNWMGEITTYLHDREYDYEGIRRYANGLEVLLRRKTGKVTGWIGFSLAVSEREAKNFLEPTTMDRRWTVLGALFIDAVPLWRFSSELFYGTGFPYSPINSRYCYVYYATRVYRGWTPIYGLFGSARLPEAFRWDVKIERYRVLRGDECYNSPQRRGLHLV
jgi:hypothetical protein